MSNFTNEKKAALVTGCIVICIALVLIVAYTTPALFNWMVTAAFVGAVVSLIYRFVLEMFFEDDDDYYCPY